MFVCLKQLGSLVVSTTHVENKRVIMKSNICRRFCLEKTSHLTSVFVSDSFFVPVHTMWCGAAAECAAVHRLRVKHSVSSDLFFTLIKQISERLRSVI